MTDVGREPAEGRPSPPQASPLPAPRSPKSTLRAALGLYIAHHVVYGLPMLVWPKLVWETAGAEGVSLTAVESNRWIGGLLIAWAAGALLVFLRPHGQRTFVTTIALESSVAAFAVIYGVVANEFDIFSTWFGWLTGAIFVLLAVVIWGARWTARDVIGP